MVTTEPDMSPKEAAAVLGLHHETVRRLCRDGELGYKVGDSWRIPRAELDKLRKMAAAT